MIQPNNAIQNRYYRNVYIYLTGGKNFKRGQSG